MKEHSDLLRDAIEACDGWYRISRHLVNCLNPKCEVRRRAGLGMAVSDLTFDGYETDLYEGCVWPNEDNDKDPFDCLNDEEPF